MYLPGTCGYETEVRSNFCERITVRPDGSWIHATSVVLVQVLGFPTFISVRSERKVDTVFEGDSLCRVEIPSNTSTSFVMGGVKFPTSYAWIQRGTTNYNML